MDSRLETRSLFTFTWYCDPAILETQTQLEQINTILTNPLIERIQVYEEPVDSIIVKHVASVMLKPSDVPPIQQLISKISYSALTFGVQISDYKIYDVGRLQDFKTCIQAYVRKFFGVRVKTVTQTTFTNDIPQLSYVPACITFTPLSHDGLPIFRTTAQQNFMRSMCSFSKLKGLQHYLTDPLAAYALSVIPESFSKDFISLDGMIFIRSPQRSLTDQVPNSENLFDLKTKVKLLKAEGIFHIPKVSSTMLGLCSEVAQMMALVQLTPTTFQRKLPLHDLCSADWLIESASRISRGDVPRIRLSGWWSTSDYIYPFGDVAQESVDRFVARLQFATWKSYVQVCNKNPILESFLPFAQVNSDFTITIPVVTFEDANVFLDEFPDTYSEISTFDILSASSLTDAVLLRYFLASHLSALSLVIPRNKGFYIVTPTDLSGVIVPTIGKLALEQATLLAAIRFQVQIRLGPIQLESVRKVLNKVQSLTLPELIEWTFVPFEPFFVHRKVALSGGTPISVSRNLYWTYALQGLYPFELEPSIPSLNANFPLKYLIEPNSEFKLVLSGTDILVQDSGNLVPLIQIPQEMKPGQAFELYQKLWSCGWFLSNWATALMWKLDRLSVTIQGVNQIVSRLASKNTDSNSNLELIQLELQKTSVAWCLSTQNQTNRT